MAILGCIGLLLILMVFSVSPTFGVILLVVLLVLGFYTEHRSKRKREENEDQQRSIRETGISNLRKQTDFEVTSRFVGNPQVSQMISIDENKKKVSFIDGEQYRVYNYRDILSSEVLIDGNEIIKTSRTSQIGGALIGGILAGGVGAIIGGLSADQTKESKVSKVDVLIVVNDTRNPTFVLNFFNKDDKDSLYPYPIEMVKDEIEQAQQLHRLISVLIRQADEADLLEEQKNKKEIKPSESSSFADEIRKLADLKAEGLLTNEEFIQQKNLLMHSSSGNNNRHEVHPALQQTENKTINNSTVTQMTLVNENIVENEELKQINRDVVLEDVDVLEFKKISKFFPNYKEIKRITFTPFENIYLVFSYNGLIRADRIELIRYVGHMPNILQESDLNNEDLKEWYERYCL
jgi:hypothetical protein